MNVQKSKKKPKVVYSVSSDTEMINFLYDWSRSLDNSYIKRVADRFSELVSHDKKSL